MFLHIYLITQDILFFFLICCSLTLPVGTLSTRLVCFSCCCLGANILLVCLPVTTPQLSFFFSHLRNIYRPYASSLPVRVMTHVSTQTLAVVAADYNEIADSSTATSYRKCKLGSLVHQLGFFHVGKVFDPIFYRQVMMISHHLPD